MTSLCSDASSSVSSRPRQTNEDTSWDRMNEESQKRKDKNSIFSASPWEREEKEKLQQEQVLDARRARDEEIAHLEDIVDRSDKQNEWLRILRLEREFQRRAEQELDDEEGSVCSDTSSTDSDKIANFPRDKLTVIPNERIGLKLLDELLDNPSKNPTPSKKCHNEREISLKSPSEKHFIPLDVAIPDNEIQTSSFPLTNNILKISSDQPLDGGRATKPPVPAPRPSKAVMSTPDIQKSNMAELSIDNCQINSKVHSDMDTNISSLTKLEISDSSAFFCSTDNEENISRDTQPDNWLIEVPNNFPDREEVPRTKQNGNSSNDQSRIYENIKPADYHYLRTQAGGFNSHTLPKSTNIGPNSTIAKNGSRHVEKKFPVMGVSSTLTKKSNGFVPSDADILPSLYASYKAQNGYVKEVPSDIADKSPEFKKLWISRPEKLTFQDKIRKFSLQAGEDDLPRDRVKNSRAQREIENKFSDAQKRALGLQKTTEA